MSSPYSGVQKRISDIEATALYMHCCSYKINLIINDAVRDTKEISNFFAIFLFKFMRLNPSH